MGINSRMRKQAPWGSVCYTWDCIETKNRSGIPHDNFKFTEKSAGCQAYSDRKCRNRKGRRSRAAHLFVVMAQKKIPLHLYGQRAEKRTPIFLDNLQCLQSFYNKPMLELLFLLSNYELTNH